MVGRISMACIAFYETVNDYVRFKYMKCLVLNIILIVLYSGYSAKCQNTGCIEPFETYDTITVNGNFIKYHVSNDKAHLEYGNHDFQKFFPKEFDCDIADAWVPKLKYDNKDFMLLHYGCGSTCWGLILLPLNPIDKIRDIMYDLAYDPETTSLVYTDNENLLVENITTKEIKTIKLPQCGAANMIYCLDSVSIRKSELKYQFYGPHKIDAKPIMKSYTIKIKPKHI